VTQEAAKSSKDIIKAFLEGASKSQAGRQDNGKNKLLMNHFLQENERMLRISML
jgi:hypothetical protein